VLQATYATSAALYITDKDSAQLRTQTKPAPTDFAR